MGRKVALILSLGVLIFTGVVGIYNGFSERGEERGTLQHSVTIGVVLYGIFGLVSAYGLVRRRRWSLRAVVAWGIPVTYVPGAAIMAYAEPASVGSAIAASAGSLVIALGVFLTTNVMTRAQPLGTERSEG